MIKKDFTISPITKFIVWCILGLLICLIGITNVFADTYSSSQFSAQLYDNYGPSLSSVTTDYTNSRWQGTIPNMTANSSGAAWGISSPVILIANHTYSLTAKITGTYGGNIRTSTYNRIGVGTSLANAKTSYQNNTNVTENYSGTTNSGDTIQFAFTPTINGNFIVFAFSTTSSGSNWTFYLYDIVIDDLGSSGGISQSDINNSLNSQTNVLNQSITNSQNAIIDNQNQNAQETQDAINDNLNTCYPAGNVSFTTEQGKELLSINGQTNTKPGWLITSYIRVYSGTTYTHSGFSSTFIAIYDKNKNYIRGIREASFTPDNTEYYIRMNSTIENYNGVISQNGYCVSKLDDQTNSINGVNDSINNDNVDENGIASAFDSFNNYLDDNSTITQLITLPVTLYTAILNNLNGTCQPFNLGNLYGSDLILPCINISQYLGNALWSMIDIIISGFAIYAISKKMIKVFNNFSSLREGDVIDD